MCMHWNSERALDASCLIGIGAALLTVYMPRLLTHVTSAVRVVKGSLARESVVHSLSRAVAADQSH